jgi:hypothetical protein
MSESKKVNVLVSDLVYSDYSEREKWLSFVAGIILLIVAFYFFNKNLLYSMIFFFLCIASVGYTIYTIYGQSNQFEIFENETGGLELEIKSGKNSLKMPVFKLSFFYEDNLHGQVRTVELYSVFYDQKNVPVLRLSETTMAAFVFFPKPGYEKVTGDTEFPEKKKCYSGPVQKIYDLCDKTNL